MHIGPMRQLLAEAPRTQTASLFVAMLLVRLTEGIGLFLLVPLLEIVSKAGRPSALSSEVLNILQRVGVGTSMGALLAVFVGLIALRAALLFAQQALSVRYQYGVIDQLRTRLFASVLRAEWRWLVDKRISDFANLLTTGVGRIGAGLSQLIALIAGTTTLFAYGIAAFILSWQVTLIAIAIGAIAYALFSRHRANAAALGFAVNDANRSLQSKVQDGLAAIRLTKLSQAEARHSENFADVIARLRNKQLAFSISSGLGDAGLQVGGAATLAALLYGGLIWLALPLSIMLTMVLIFARLLPVFAATQQSYHLWLHTRAALVEFEEKLEQARAVAEPAALPDVPPLELSDAIVFDHVSFAYDATNPPVANQLSFRIPAKTTTAVTGPSGSGKSTFADLLTGLLSPDSGRILIDDVPLNADNRIRWRQSFAYVQQDSFLFHDTILANLKWAHPDATDQEIRDALGRASADFVFAFPDGLETVVGDSGQKLSGGERQRIALARALLAKPELLVLDEATSALDLDNEAIVHKALGKLRGQLTIVIIGHRLGERGIADHILRFEGNAVRFETLEPVNA